MFILAQVVGFLAFLVYALSYWQKKRIYMLMFQVADSSLYALHYLLLSAMSGFAVNMIAILRAFIYLYKDKNKLLSSVFLPISFCLLYGFSLIFTYNGTISILPVLAVCILCIVTWQRNEMKIRLGSLVVAIIWLIYNIFVNSYIGIATEGIIFVSTVIAIINYKKKENQFLN